MVRDLNVVFVVLSVGVSRMSKPQNRQRTGVGEKSFGHMACPFLRSCTYVQPFPEEDGRPRATVRVRTGNRSPKGTGQDVLDLYTREFSEFLEREEHSLFEENKGFPLSETKIRYASLTKMYPGLTHKSWEEFAATDLGERIVNNYRGLFLAAHDLFQCYVCKELDENAVKDHSSFTVFRADPRKNNTRSRIDLMARLGIVYRFLLSQSIFSNTYGLVHLWYYNSEKIRPAYLEKFKENLADAPNFAKNVTFQGSFLPLEFTFSKKQILYTRLLQTNYVSWQNLDKTHEKKPLARQLEKLCNVKIYNVDMGACHLRVLSKYTDSFTSPEVYKAVSHVDYWSELADKLIAQRGWENKYYKKPVRKVFKVGVLAIMNGGRPGNVDHFLHLLKGANDKKNTSLVKIAPILSESIQTAPITHEILSICKRITGIGKGFNLVSNFPISPPKGKNAHTLLSNLWASGETLLLTYVIQALHHWLHETHIRAVPLSYEHDGLSIMVLDDHTNEDLDKLANIIERLTNLFVGMSIGIDITRLIDD